MTDSDSVEGRSGSGVQEGRRRGQMLAAWRRDHAVAVMVARRGVEGVVVLLVVSIVIFAATQLLPGNAAYAVLGHSATPQRVRTVEQQLHLNRPAVIQYVTWLEGLLHGNFGTSLVDGVSVAHLVLPRIINTGVLVLLAGTIGGVVSIGLGMVAGLRRGRAVDHWLSLVALTSLGAPSFVVAVILITLLASAVSHILPAVSIIPPNADPLKFPSLLVLPTATLVVAIFPYIFRMARGTTIEALQSDYVEYATLKGVPTWRLLISHVIPNILGVVIQVVALNFVYLAGGVVVVEDVFNYPGIGQALVGSVSDRDIPVIQFVVLLLAGFYVVVNILADVTLILVTPQRRVPK